MNSTRLYSLESRQPIRKPKEILSPVKKRNVCPIIADKCEPCSNILWHNLESFSGWRSSIILLLILPRVFSPAGGRTPSCLRIALAGRIIHIGSFSVNGFVSQ